MPPKGAHGIPPDDSLKREELREGLDLIRSQPHDSCDELLVRALELIKLAHSLGDGNAAGYLHANVIRMIEQQNRHGEAQEYGLKIISELRLLDDKQPLMAALNALAINANNLGDFPGSMEFANEALLIARQINRYDAIGHITSNIGLDFTYMGEYEQALEYFKESLDAWEKNLNSEGKANAYLNQGLVYKHFQDFGAARNAYNEALKLYQKVDYAGGLAAAYRNLSECSLLEGKTSEAHELVLRSLRYAREAQGALREAHSLAHKGSVEIALGNVVDARKDLEAALKVYEELNIPRGRVGVWVHLASLSDTEPVQSLKFLRAALKDSEEFQLKPEQVRTHRELSLKFKEQGDFQVALEHLEKCFELEKNILSENAERRARSLQMMHQVAQERAVADLERLRNVELNAALQAVEKQRKHVIEESHQKTQLLSVSAHDLRNMTGGILSGIDILRDGLSSSKDDSRDELVELLDHMAGSADELHQTMMQLMDAGSIEAQDFKLEKCAVDLVGLLNAQISQWQSRAHEKGQTIEFEVCEDCSATLDLSRMRSVISNLLSNAIKYSPENGIIVLSLQSSPDEIRITVQDSGPGLQEEDLKLWGRPFQRLSAKPTGGEISVGLGLFIVRHTVELHGGDLVVGNSDGGGACFCVRLPVADIN